MNVKEDRKIQGKELNMIGVIGKNGKSTISQMIHQCYQALEIESQFISATEFFNKVNMESYEKSVKDVIIEISLCTIRERRASYIDFDHLIFTNSSEAVDSEEKWTMMRPFIALPINKKAIINIDDEHGAEFCHVTIAKTITYALDKPADINARNIKLSLNKTTFDLYHEGNFICKTEIPYFGTYNLYNILATVSYFVSEGYDPARVAQLLPNLPQIEGHFDIFSTDTCVKVVIDYARTPEAISAVLKSLATICQGDIITVIGADGNTSAAERMAIGKNVLAYSKQVIFTNDNPRTEEPQGIIYDLIKGSIKQNYRICMDREKAIEIALKMSKPKDVVALLGKGHEKMQIIGEKKNVFCDKTTVKYLAQKFEI